VYKCERQAARTATYIEEARAGAAPRAPLCLLFAATDDLRNLIETVVSLDEAVAAGDADWPSAGVDIRFNNPDATAFTRNLVMLRLLLEAGEREEVLHAVLTMW
jgi:hypothetical protein